MKKKAYISTNDSLNSYMAKLYRILIINKKSDKLAQSKDKTNIILLYWTVKMLFIFYYL